MTQFSNPYLKSYSKAPVMGALFGALLVLVSIALSAHGFLAFFSLEGLMIVGGGVIAVAFMSLRPCESSLLDATFGTSLWDGLGDGWYRP